MCGVPKDPKVQTIPERQAMKLPDNGETSTRVDDIAKRRRGMLATVMTGASGLGAPPATTNSTLGI